jgi:4'-phosphopantetheinyl transferase
MKVWWTEQIEADVPATNQWLSQREMIRLGKLRFAKRRTDWRLGRWTAKNAVASFLNRPKDLQALANIEILAAASGAPEVFVDQKDSVTISLSHSCGAAVCAVAAPKIDLGCDLERIESRSEAFISDYLTIEEQAVVERTSNEERPLLVTLLWSAKESALKALHVGLRFAANSMDASSIGSLSGRTQKLVPNSLSLLTPACAEWLPLRARSSSGQDFHGWWRHADQMVYTVVSSHPLSSPVDACLPLDCC